MVGAVVAGRAAAAGIGGEVESRVQVRGWQEEWAVGGAKIQRCFAWAAAVDQKESFALVEVAAYGVSMQEESC